MDFNWDHKINYVQKQTDVLQKERPTAPYVCGPGATTLLLVAFEEIDFEILWTLSLSINTLTKAVAASRIWFHLQNWIIWQCCDRSPLSSSWSSNPREFSRSSPTVLYLPILLTEWSNGKGIYTHHVIMQGQYITTPFQDLFLHHDSHTYCTCRIVYRSLLLCVCWCW